jgi:hypothetical protein
MPKLLPFAGQPTRWDRPLPEEPSRAYQAATTYFQMGPDRTQEKTAAALGKSLGTICRWARRWHWTARARQYDADRVRDDLDARADAIRAATRAWADQNVGRVNSALDLASKINDKIAEILALPIAQMEPTYRDAAALVKAKVDLERFALELMAGVKADPGVRTDLTPAEQSAALEAMTTARLAEEARQAAGG